MTVKVSKPAINVREELADLKKPTGIAGEAMLRAETPQEQFQLIGAGRRNMVINGAMEVAQRSTSVTGSTTNGAILSVDRFNNHGSGATFDSTQQSVTLGGEAGLPVQFKNYHKFNVTTGANNAGVWQTVEDVAKVQGIHTLSFYAKGVNPAGGNIDVKTDQNFGSGGSTEATVILGNIALTSTWQRYTLTFDVASVAGKTIGVNNYFRFMIYQPNGDNGSAAWNLQITGVQLEVGKIATPFEHRSYGEELALCQRYYFKSGQQWMSGQAYGVNNSQDGLVMPIYWPVTMRSSPAVSFVGGTDGGSGAALFTAFTQAQGMSVNLRSTNAYTSVWFQPFFVHANAEL